MHWEATLVGISGLNTFAVEALPSVGSCHPDRSEAERRDLTGVNSRSELNPRARTRFQSDPSTSLGMTVRHSNVTPSTEPRRGHE